MSPSKSQYHVRSNSFPTRPHPLFQQCDDHLTKLSSSDAKLSFNSVSQKLSDLEDLHDCVEKLYQLQLTQQALTQSRGEKWIDELVDGSLRLLDMCSSAKDAVLHTKECAREVHSTMRRRRRGDQLGFACEVSKYFASRKVVKKAIRKALDGNNNNKSSLKLPSNKDSVEIMALVGVVREVEAMSLSVFESLLWFVSGAKSGQGRVMSGWSLVSKLVMNKKKVSCDEDESQGDNVINEFAKVDSALQSLELNNNGKVDWVESVQNDLQCLEACVQDFDEKLERLFRRLIKIRVALLNILNY